MRSNPLPSIVVEAIGQIAQLVEQRTENPRVGGSIPPLATMSSSGLFSILDRPFFCVAVNAVYQRVNFIYK